MNGTKYLDAGAWELMMGTGFIMNHTSNLPATPAPQHSWFSGSWTNIVSLFVIPLFTTIGILGNAMGILLVRTNPNLKKLPSNIYLAFLALSSCILLNILLWQWVGDMAEWEFFYSYGCRPFTYIAHCCDMMGAWLVAFLSFERLALLHRKQWRHRFCTQDATKKIVGVLVLMTLVLNIWVVILCRSVFSEDNQVWQCGIDEENHLTIYTVMNGIDTIGSLIIPSILIIAANSVVIQKLSIYQQFLPVAPSVRFHRTSKDPILGESIPDGNVSLHSGNIDLKERRRSIRPSDLRLTRCLIIVTSLFVFLNLPACIYRFAHSVISVEYIISKFFDNVVKFLSYHLYYVHHAILFYVYIFHSPQMKKQLFPTAMKLLECYCLKPVPDFGYQS